MSYARFGWDGSDVYVYENPESRLVCCACRLNGPVVEDPDAMFGVSFPPDWTTPTSGPPYDRSRPHELLPAAAYGEMIAHLSEHVDAGHVVPDDAFDRLTLEQQSAISQEQETK